MTPEAKHLITRYKGHGRKLGIEEAAIIVNNYVTRHELTEGQYGALICFVDNRGAQAFYQSKLLKIVNEDFYPGWELRASKEFDKPCWCVWLGKYSKSMAIRRAKEKRLFLTPLLVVHNVEAKK
jgi:GH24 family phage-related lysozyme (muramidase)